MSQLGNSKLNLAFIIIFSFLVMIGYYSPFYKPCIVKAKSPVRFFEGRFPYIIGVLSSFPFYVLKPHLIASGCAT